MSMGLDVSVRMSAFGHKQTLGVAWFISESFHNRKLCTVQ